MKNILIILSLVLCSQLWSQETLSKGQWQEDLRFIQNTIHEDYAFLFVKTKVRERYILLCRRCFVLISFDHLHIYSIRKVWLYISKKVSHVCTELLTLSLTFSLLSIESICMSICPPTILCVPLPR